MSTRICNTCGENAAKCPALVKTLRNDKGEVLSGKEEIRMREHVCITTWYQRMPGDDVSST